MKPSAILLLLAGAVGISFAQVQQPANLPPHQIHSNDLVGISIYGEPDLNRTVRVDSDGAIRLPLLDRKVKAGGLMPDELEKAIAEAFKAEQILVNPFITVTVAEYHTLLPISVFRRTCVYAGLSHTALGSLSNFTRLAPSVPSALRFVSSASVG